MTTFRIDGISQDVRFALRALRRSPGFALTAIATLAVGIGVNATVFTVTNAVLFKGFPLVQGNDRLVYISGNGCCVSYPDFEDYRAQAKSFDGMAVVHGVALILTDGKGFAENIKGNENSADTFRLVGQRPMMGRDFEPSDEMPGAAPVAILNHDFWERRFGMDQSIIGRTVMMNGAPTTVIGVMPRGFSFPQTLDVWVPLVKTANVRKREKRDTWFVFGRLAPGVTIETARAEIQTIGKRLAIEYPVTNQDYRPTTQNFRDFFIGPNATLIYGAMWGAVGFVLLIACANLANLLLARAIGRRREITVRIALGAGRWRIIRQLLIESVMLSGAGGFFGWWLAKWCLRGYELAMARKASWLIVDYSMDQRVLWYLIAISIGTGILFGLAPALRLSGLDINSTLKDGGHGAAGLGRGKHLSRLLVCAEMALAVVLLAGAGVMIRSFLKIQSADMGVRTDNVLVASIGLPVERYPNAAAWSSFFDRLQSGLQAIPGVDSVALADTLPSWPARKRRSELEGAPSTDTRSLPTLSTVTISPDYFRTLGAQVISGRGFNETDGISGVPGVLVNQRFASRFWPGESAIGKRLRFFTGTTPEAWLSVVGVVSNIVQNDANRQEFGPLIYSPFRLSPRDGASVFIRSRIPPPTLANVLRQEVQALDSNLPIYGPFTLRERLEMNWDSRFYGVLFLIFAAIALLLASVGLYTVIAHAVSQRTQEIGIRVAIGATARDILSLVIVQGMIPLGLGLTLGLAASVAVNRVLQSMLVQVSPSDPLTLAVSSTVLVVAAALGCLIPARRAIRIDPVIALRHD